jgi:type VI secretion system protein ImpJ
MTTPARMLWIDGLPLSPQHFQESDRFHELSLERRVASITRGPAWGIRELRLDVRALRDGVVRIERLEAVFPDGTYVDVDAVDALPDRPIAGLGPERAKVDVHVAISRRREGRPEVGPADARLVRLERHAIDVHTDEPAEPQVLELGVPSVRIVFGHEPREDLETVLICSVRRDAAGALTLVEETVPPVLRISASDTLASQLSSLVARLTSRREALLAVRRERDADSIEVDAGGVTRFLLLQTISTHLPVLRHLLRRGDARPEILYERLLELVGGLSAFAVDAHLDVPDLDPLDLGSTLLPLFDRAARLVAATDRERSRVIPLEARADGLHFAAVDEDVARCERFLVAVRSSLPESEVLASLAGLAKVASYREIASVLSSATAGAPLHVVHRPPPEVPTRSGELYFEVAKDDRFFRTALGERGVAVYLPARPFDPLSTHVSLVAIVRGERPTDRSAPSIHGPSTSHSQSTAPRRAS